ncbi:MAG: hypothetical protein ABIZ56_09990 [Chthoniobacteraceae bacterium]
MSVFHHNGLMVSLGDRMAIVPTEDFSWFIQPGATVDYDGRVFSGERSFGEWLALTANATQTVCGICISFLEESETLDWLCRFRNVHWSDDSDLNIIFSESTSVQQPGWPFLPVSAFAGPAGDYVFRIPQYYEGV